MDNSLTRIKNPVEHSQPHSDLVTTMPLYQCVNGGTTTDITQSVKDEFGLPIQMGFSKTDVTPHAVNTYIPLSYNPKDPSARLRAIEAKAYFENQSSPQIYQDKIEAAQYAQNVCNAVINKVEQSQKPITNE